MDRLSCQQLVQTFLEFLRDQLAQGDSALGAESAESVEVAVQCLETAYNLPPPQSTNINIYDVFKAAVEAAGPQHSRHVPTDEDKVQAEQFKVLGNTNMREDNVADSVECYAKAIELDPSNAVYYCNRAAAHSKMANHPLAIADCQKALDIEPNYSKAYGRMGLAHSSMEQHREARDCYKKALELEPDNDGYTSNLAISEEKLAATPNPLAGLLGAGGGLGALSGAFSGSGTPDLSGLLANPALVNMATQLMADPNMQTMMSNIIGGNMTGGTTTSTSTTSSFTTSTTTLPPTVTTSSSTTTTAAPAGQPEDFPGIDALLTAGRQLAEQMQSQHPEFLNQLRAHMGPQQQPPPQP